MEHQYRLKYSLNHEVGSFNKEQITEGGCDALLIFSLIYPPDGSYSQYFYSIDGRNEGKELDDNELFKIWSLMAKRLSESTTLGVGKRTFAETVWKTMQEVVINDVNLSVGNKVEGVIDEGSNTKADGPKPKAP